MTARSEVLDIGAGKISYTSFMYNFILIAYTAQEEQQNVGYYSESSVSPQSEGETGLQSLPNRRLKF